MFAYVFKPELFYLFIIYQPLALVRLGMSFLRILGSFILKCLRNRFYGKEAAEQNPPWVKGVSTFPVPLVSFLSFPLVRISLGVVTLHIHIRLVTTRGTWGFDCATYPPTFASSVRVAVTLWDKLGEDGFIISSCSCLTFRWIPLNDFYFYLVNT